MDPHLGILPKFMVCKSESYNRANVFWNPALYPYGQKWRRQRKLLHLSFNINESKVYREKVEKHSMSVTLMLW
jgi:hypothetical protein